MGRVAELLVLRPRRRPPVPSTVTSWALTNINVHSEHLAKEQTAPNFAHLRNALIEASHVTGEPEEDAEVNSHLPRYRAVNVYGSHTLRTQQPAVRPLPAAGMPAAMPACRPTTYGGPPNTSIPGEAAYIHPSDIGMTPQEALDQHHRRLSTVGAHAGRASHHLAPDQLHPAAATHIAEQLRSAAPSMTSPSLLLQKEPREQRPQEQQPRELEQLHQQRQYPQPQGPRPPGQATVPSFTRSRALGLQAATSDWDTDLLDGLDIGIVEEPAAREHLSRPNVSCPSSFARDQRLMADPRPREMEQAHRHQHQQQRQQQHQEQQRRQQQQQHQQVDFDERQDTGGDAIAIDGGAAVAVGGKWWEDLDDTLGPPETSNQEPPRSAAPVSRRGISGLRQSVLTPRGGFVLPPPPPPGMAWKAARPASAPSPGAVAEQPQQHHQHRGHVQMRRGQVERISAVEGVVDRKRNRDSTYGEGEVAEAAGVGPPGRAPKRSSPAAPVSPVPMPAAPSGGGGGAGGAAAAAAAGKGGKKKRGGKEGAVVGGPVEALLSQLLPLCEALEVAGAAGGAPVREVSNARMASELVGDIARSHLLVVGLLMAVCEGSVYQYASNMQSLSKAQRDALLKARRMLAKDPKAAASCRMLDVAASATANDGHRSNSSTKGSESGSGRGSGSAPRFGSGVLATEHLERCVAFCVLCLDEKMYDDALLDSGAAFTASGRTAAGATKGCAAEEGHAVLTIHKAPMYLLRTTAWPPAAVGRGLGLMLGEQSPSTAPQVPPCVALLSLLDELLVRAPCPAICCNAKALLREAVSLGWRSPPPQQLRLTDPCVLAWMEAPQLAARDEKEIGGYSLEALCPRYGIVLQPPQSPEARGGGATANASSPAGGPLHRIRLGLFASVRLFEAVRLRVDSWLQPKAVQVEMQVAWVLARMEALGIAVDSAGLKRTAAAVRQRMEVLSSTASALLGGRPLNLGSSSQVAVVLYEELKLPPPVPPGQRDVAAGPGKDRSGRVRTHHSTDEAALKQISHLHPLPSLVLQYRALQNVVSKWLEPDWLSPLIARSRAGAVPGAPAAAPAPGGCPAAVLPRLACCWNQTATATGRLSSSAPNMQAVTKYEVVVQLGGSGTEAAGAAAARASQVNTVQTSVSVSDRAGEGGGGDGGGRPERGGGAVDSAVAPEPRSLVVVARNAFVAPAGRLLVAADYSQIELRLLAHLSGDLRLQELLKRGQEGRQAPDAFRLIAAAWLRQGTDPGEISVRDREQVKRVVYGIIYGMTPQGLAQQLAEYGIGLEEAVALRSSFLRHFAGVQAFITSSLHHARRHGYITTGLLGRRRPIAGVASTDPRVRADAERKVVNSIVQGSAADLVKCAMCMWAAFNHVDTHRQQQHQPPQVARAPLTNRNLQDQPPLRSRTLPPGITDSGATRSDPLLGPATSSTLRAGAIPTLLGETPQAALLPASGAALPAARVPLDAELVAQIHDELVFEVDARPEVVRRLVAVVRGIMCGVVALEVPLLVKVAVGQSWGALQELPPGFAEVGTS